jgi:hypothetical protein
MSDFKQRLSDLRFNPMLMQNLILDELEAQTSGQGSYDVPDASNPFVFLMEASVLNASMNVSEGEALLRRLYPRMALTSDELYLHMADDDYIGRFSSPSWTTFDFYIGKDEVLAKAVATDVSGVRKLVIPRLTNVVVAGVTFTMQYPIEIRIMSHGGIQVVYGTDQTSPIQVLESNMVDWDMVTLNRENLLLLRVPMGQFAVTTHNETLNAAAGFDVDYSFQDHFYFARAYLADGRGGWTEIRTTHTDQVYDPTNPTAVLQVKGSSLNVKVPLVYFSQGLMTDEIRIDIYTTKGKLEMDLGSYQAAQFVTQFNAIDDDRTYVSPLNTFTRFQALNLNRVNGGSGAVSFEELRNQVIHNTLGTSQTPITHAQLGTVLQSRGFGVVTNIDNITNRQFLASRKLPAPANKSVAGGIGCVMGQLQLTLAQWVGSAHVLDNGDRLTVKPSALYEFVNGVIQPVPDAEITRLLSFGPDALTRQVNGRRFLYSPLHYVFDTSNKGFDVRPYYLDRPEVVRKVFVDENDTAQYQASIARQQFERIEGGYRLTVTVVSGDQFKALNDANVVLQLGYRPVGENNYASLNGTLVGKEDNERVYQFDLLTNFDLDAANNLRTTNLSMYDLAQRDFRSELEHDFDLSFIVVDLTTPGYRPTLMDNQVQRHLLPDEYMVLARERLRLRFGYALTNLWRRNRSLISSASYRQYAQDVPWLYESTVYKRDSNGQIVLGYDAEGNITYEVEHQAGDPVLDAEGNPTFRYLKGDVVLDANGQPELISPRQILREFTLFLLDGCYYFATDGEATAYRDDVPMQVVNWLRNDIGAIKQQLLEQSELYLHPTTTLGDTVAVVREGLKSTLALDQHFYVNYYLTDTAYGNASLREALTASTREIVNELLGRETVAVSDIVSRLKANAGEDVINIEAGGLGGDNNFTVVSITDKAVRLALRKRLTVLSNQFLAVQDDLDINFMRHSVAR